MKILFFKTSADFRRWLRTKHKTSDELWVGFHKKSTGRPSITYPEALDEALCYGWIDGLRKSVKGGIYTVRFTPRKAKSQWSAVNVKRTEELLKKGRMQPSGREAFEGATDQPRKYSDEQRHAASLDTAMERQFRANPEAWSFFQRQAPWYRRTSTFWVVSAKKEDTRQKRFATLVSDCENHMLIKPLRRPALPKRPEK